MSTQLGTGVLTNTGGSEIVLDRAMLVDAAGAPLIAAGVTAVPVSTSPVASTAVPTVNKNAGTVTAAAVKASAGNVFSILVTNANAAARYFQLHNKATIPLAAETAQLYFVIPAGNAAQPAVVELTGAFFAPSERFATGIGWAISTTITTFTDAATAADHTVQVRFL